MVLPQRLTPPVPSPRGARTQRQGGLTPRRPAISPRAKVLKPPQPQVFSIPDVPGEALPLVRGLPASGKAKATKKGTETVDGSWAQQVFESYDRDQAGSIDLGDLELAFRDLRLPASTEVLEAYVKAVADAEGVGMGNYTMHGVPSADFLKIYRQILANQPPSVRKRATTAPTQEEGEKTLPTSTLSDIRSQEFELREAFDRQSEKDANHEVTCTQEGIEEAMRDVGLPDVKGDNYESFLDFWVLKRSREEGVTAEPVDEKEDRPATFDFQEFSLMVNDYHTFADNQKKEKGALVPIREEKLHLEAMVDQWQAIDPFQSLRMVATPRGRRPEVGLRRPQTANVPQTTMATTPRLMSPRPGTSQGSRPGTAGQGLGEYGNKVSCSFPPASNKSLASVRQEMGICA